MSVCILSLFKQFTWSSLYVDLLRAGNSKNVWILQCCIVILLKLNKWFIIILLCNNILIITLIYLNVNTLLFVHYLQSWAGYFSSKILKICWVMPVWQSEKFWVIEFYKAYITQLSLRSSLILTNIHKWFSLAWLHYVSFTSPYYSCFYF